MAVTPAPCPTDAPPSEILGEFGDDLVGVVAVTEEAGQVTAGAVVVSPQASASWTLVVHEDDTGFAVNLNGQQVLRFDRDGVGVAEVAFFGGAGSSVVTLDNGLPVADRVAAIETLLGALGLAVII